MNNGTNHPKSNPLQPWHGPLTSEGFLPQGAAYQFKGVSVESAGNWFVLKTEGLGSAPQDTLAQPGQPGFWKHIPQAHGAMGFFEFPQAAVSADEESDPAKSGLDTSLGAFLRWALAARTNSIPPGWRPPPRKLVESWMPTGALTVQCGSIVRQGELILTSERWALRFPILTGLPADLPAARVQWLRDVLAHAHDIWRMVRVGLEADSGNHAVVVKLDFTGAPHSEYLFLAGLDGVRHVAAWLAESVALVADAKIASQALAVHPHSNPKPERKNKCKP